MNKSASLKSLNLHENDCQFNRQNSGHIIMFLQHFMNRPLE